MIPVLANSRKTAAWCLNSRSNKSSSAVTFSQGCELPEKAYRHCFTEDGCQISCPQTAPQLPPNRQGYQISDGFGICVPKADKLIILRLLRPFRRLAGRAMLRKRALVARACASSAASRRTSLSEVGAQRLPDTSPCGVIFIIPIYTMNINRHLIDSN